MLAVGMNVSSPGLSTGRTSLPKLFGLLFIVCPMEILIAKTEGVGGWADGLVDGSVCKMVALQA